MKIALIGSGNVATFYGTRFHEAGHTIVQVLSNTLEHAQWLGTKLNCNYINSMDELTSEADVYILAMNDNSVKKQQGILRLPNKVVIHTAGSIALNELNNISEHVGSIWCLYSIQKEELPTRTDIPTFINYSTEKVKECITILAKALSSHVVEMNDDQKLRLHLAAVLVNNYTNHLAAVAEHILADAKVPYQYLLPIMHQTVDKLTSKAPSQSQTGPALRGDTEILDKHLMLLQEHPKWKALYKALADSISSMNKNS